MTQATSFSWLNHHHAHIKAVAAVAVLDKGGDGLISRNMLPVLSYLICCVWLILRNIPENTMRVCHLKNAYFYLYENLGNLEMFGIEQDEQKPVQSSA